MWMNATVRHELSGIPVGTKVLVTPSKVKHTGIGPCWWVYDGTYFRQVPESFGGARLYKHITLGKAFSKQDQIEARFAKFWKKFRRLLKTP